MNNSACLLRPWAVILLALTAAGASAQLVPDGGTAVINGTTTNVSGFLTVGNAGPNTTLIVTNGGRVTTDHTLIGGNSGASNNLITVSGAGSWLSTAGAGSVLRVGNGAPFNRLLISSGGVVSNGYGVVGYPVGASGNSVLVTGAGSAWTNGVLYVGEGSSGNSLEIASGGTVVAAISEIGVLATASNNWATASGLNTIWRTANDLLVGDAGGGARLSVNNSATVASGGNVVLGNQSTSVTNLLSVGSGRVLATNAGGTGALDVRRGTVEINGGLVVVDRLLLTNSAGSFSFGDGTLITRSATISNQQDFAVGSYADPSPAGTTFANNTLITVPASGSAGPYPSVINVANLRGAISKVTVTLSNLSHTFPNDLDVLLVGPAGQKVMLMSDVGGGNPGVTNVTLTFDDAAAPQLSLSSNPTSGSYRPTDVAPGADPFPQPAPPGPYSTNLSDFNGGSANGAWSLYIVDDASGDSGSLGSWGLNIVTTPAGATWDVRSNATATVVQNYLYLGRNGGNAGLLVTNGSTLAVNGQFYLGDGDISSNNLAVIAGPGSLATIDGEIHVGQAGLFNTLLVTNGGRVMANVGDIGNSGDFNHVTVEGQNSSWTLADHLSIGVDGSFSSLLIANGGRVTNANNAVLGYFGGSSNNVVTVTGTNSTFFNGGFLSMGFVGGVNNRLAILNGGTMFNQDATVGDSDSSDNNQVIVNGPGALWVNRGKVVIGKYGSFNSLIVSNEGVALAASAYLGSLASSAGNRITVDGGALHTTNAAGNAVLDIRRGTNVLNSGLIEADNLLLTNTAGFFEFNSGTLITRGGTINNGQNFLMGAAPVESSAMGNAIAINDFSVANQGRANPYPSVINVAGINGGIAKVTVTLSGLTHTFARDINAVLVGPTGQKVLLMREVGGIGASASANNVTLTFDDAAAPIPQNVKLTSGSFHPTSYAGVDTSLPVPAPAGPYSTNLTDFNGSNANGMWSLYIMDDQAGDTGNLGGWSLKILAGRAANWDVRSNIAPTTINGELHIGESSPGAQLLVTNGGTLFVSGDSHVGNQSNSSNNLVVVSGANSVWTNSANWISVGQFGSFNTLLITNGGSVRNNQGYIGALGGANNNLVTVAGSNSVWQNNQSLFVGYLGSSSSLLIANGGSVQAASVYLGFYPASINNRVTIEGGTLRSTNVAGNAVLDIRRGTNVLTTGTIETDILSVTNGGGHFEFNGGRLNARSATVANGTIFTVGNGITAATYNMTGTNTHSFADGIRIANNSMLTGNGNVNSVLTVANGGTLSPGTSIGRIVLFFAPSLQGNVAMEISKNGAIRASDRVDCSVAFAYSGSLTVTNLGPAALAVGDSFQLFNAPGYSGSFSSITLPALSAGLIWTNRLLLNGSIAVISQTGLNIGGITRNGTNLIYNVTGGTPGSPWNQLTTTNVALPMADWTTNSSGFFDLQGNATVTNGVSSTEPKRFFRFKTP